MRYKGSHAVLDGVNRVIVVLNLVLTLVTRLVVDVLSVVSWVGSELLTVLVIWWLIIRN